MDSVLRMTELPRPMIDLNLADAIAACSRQHRNEAVQLAVEPYFLEHFSAIALHAAVVIVQPDAGQPADHQVENSTGPDLVPGIVAHALPAADHVKYTGPAFIRTCLLVSLSRCHLVSCPLQRGQKTRYLGRIVLQVCVEGHDQVTLGRMEAGCQC